MPRLDVTSLSRTDFANLLNSTALADTWVARHGSPLATDAIIKDMIARGMPVSAAKEIAIHSSAAWMLSQLRAIHESPPPPETPHIVDTQKQAAACIGISSKQLSRWIKAGAPVIRGNPPRYDLIAIARWDEARKNVPAGGDQSSKAEKERWQAAKIRMEVEQKATTLVPRVDMEQKIGRMLTAVKNALLNMSGKLTPQLAGMEHRDINNIIDREIRVVIRTFGKMTVGDEIALEPDPPAPPKPKRRRKPAKKKSAKKSPKPKRKAAKKSPLPKKPPAKKSKRKPARKRKLKGT